MTFKNNRAPLLCYFKLCAAFRSHWWIQTGVTVRKHLIWVKIDNFFLAVWPWNLTYDLVILLKIGFKSLIFLPMLRWYLYDLEIWWMTLENNRASLLYHIKHCTSFQSHQWIKTGVTVWKRSIRVNICDFLSRVTLKLIDDLEKQ